MRTISFLRPSFSLLLFLFVWLSSPKSYAFSLLDDTELDVVAAQDEEAVVHKALEMFASDRMLVAGKGVSLSDNIGKRTVLVGTIGKNPHINRLAAQGRISFDKIDGAWEAFQIQILKEEDKDLLLVVGSDRRGTAYGILELSRLIGVSPWVWWADCLPDKKSHFELPDDYLDIQRPSVQYRGIFINDEDLGFMPWSTQTVDHTTRKGATGPVAYEKVFQLLLRLRANTLWPAMHECTVPFHTVEGNKEMADQYAIVIGSSHCDPLLRIGGTEWDAKKRGEYNYVTNKNALIDFWSERLEEAGRYENLYTIGLRGVHDVGMVGANTLAEKTEVVEAVLKDQQELLRKYVSTDIDQLPQVFVPYKEVLPIYENGLHVPEDIMLMWSDDNFGYITRQSNAVEQARKGGAGIYYHLSYLGRPHQYIWLSGTQPSLVYWQMKKAWEHGARRIWIANVGDIKPAEFDMEFFLDMAWNIGPINENTVYDYQERWLRREFGNSFARELSTIRNEYYRLSHIRRPEMMGWSRQEESGYPKGRTPVGDTEFNPYLFGDEIHQRLKAYERIMEASARIGELIPSNKKDAYYQLIHFPNWMSSEMNKKLLYAQKAKLYAGYGLPVANEYSRKSTSAYQTIVDQVRFYNKEMSAGKWDKMMFHRAWGAPVYGPAPLPDTVVAAKTKQVLIWPEKYLAPLAEESVVRLTPFVVPEGTETFVSILALNNVSPHWELIDKPDWMDIYEEDLDLVGEKRIIFSVNADKTGSIKKTDEGVCRLKINELKYDFYVRVSINKESLPAEYDRLIVINASDYTPKGESPTAIQGLGYSMKALELKKGKENAIQYDVFTSSSGEASIQARFLPNHPVDSEDIRYAISVDGEDPQIVSILSDFKNRDEEWKINVMRNQSLKSTRHLIKKPGKHTVTIYALDEGIVLDQLALDFQPERKYYALPEKRSIKGMK